jgi:5-methylcytosine-specific restriction endonuclease McrA
MNVRQISTYKLTDADRRVRKEVKQERGCTCEKCGQLRAPERLHIHHILETRIFPELAREPLNMLVLCERCHAQVSSGEAQAASCRVSFYATLRPEIRMHHSEFLRSTKVASAALLEVFQQGGSDYWNEKAVRDLTR